MAPLEVLEKATGVGHRVRRSPRISVTELSRSTDWRKRIPEDGVIEVTDRGGTAAWLVSDDDMRALVEGFALLEEELEQAQVAAIFDTRSDAHPVLGNQLRTRVHDIFEARKRELREVIDGH